MSGCRPPCGRRRWTTIGTPSACLWFICARALRKFGALSEGSSSQLPLSASSRAGHRLQLRRIFELHETAIDSIRWPTLVGKYRDVNGLRADQSFENLLEALLSGHPAVTNICAKHAMLCRVLRAAGCAWFQDEYSENVWFRLFYKTFVDPGQPTLF